jgi:archaellum component FlaC
MHNLTDEIIEKRREVLYEQVSDDLRAKIAQYLTFAELEEILPNCKDWRINTILEQKKYRSGHDVINAIVDKLIAEDVRSHVAVLYKTLLSVNPENIQETEKRVNAHDSQIEQMMKITDKTDERVNELMHMGSGNSADIKYMKDQIEALRDETGRLQNKIAEFIKKQTIINRDIQLDKEKK